MIFVIGDVHGRWNAADMLLDKMERIVGGQPDYVIQVGDMGVGFPGRHAYWGYDRPYPLYFIDGNHDNHDILATTRFPFAVCSRRVEHLPRGTVKEVEGFKALCLGGGASIDKAWRVEGESWWAGEEITYSQAQHALDNAGKAGGVDLMFTHERPDGFPIFDSFKDDHPPSLSQRRLLEGVRQAIRPDVWIFGHYHEPAEGETERCKWYCAPDVIKEVGLVIEGRQVNWVY